MAFVPLLSKRIIVWFGVLATICVCAPRASADPWADAVISYTPGANPEPDYAGNPNVALGSPERVSGKNTPFPPFPGGVTMFSGAYGVDEIVSVGAGGSLVVRFDDPIDNDAANPFGVDLLLFGNSFFTTNDFVNPDPMINGLGSEPGQVDVSSDGINWFSVTPAADALFPTQGHVDSGVFGDPIGSAPTSFLTPVDPSLTLADFVGKTYSQALAMYAGSGGGTPIDIGPTGLASVSYVRVSLPEGANWSTEVDAFADVPEPSTLAMLFVAGVFAIRRTRWAGLVR